jgi:peptide deformylase
VSLLDIRVLGDPILRQETKPVAKVTDDLRQLIDQMFETMYAAKGIGLAAPQVGRTERLAVVDVEKNPLVIINPAIVVADGKPVKGEEGCLSIPEVYGDVERPEHVVVRAMDRDGKSFEVDAHELFSRCLQHEIDHLHGKLFIDYLSVLKRRAAMNKWQKEKDKYPGSVRKLSAEEIARHHHNDEEL